MNVNSFFINTSRYSIISSMYTVHSCIPIRIKKIIICPQVQQEMTSIFSFFSRIALKQTKAKNYQGRQDSPIQLEPKKNSCFCKKRDVIFLDKTYALRISSHIYDCFKYAAIRIIPYKLEQDHTSRYQRDPYKNKKHNIKSKSHQGQQYMPIRWLFLRAYINYCPPIILKKSLIQINVYAYSSGISSI